MDMTEKRKIDSAFSRGRKQGRKEGFAEGVASVTTPPSPHVGRSCIRCGGVEDLQEDAITCAICIEAIRTGSEPNGADRSQPPQQQTGGDEKHIGIGMAIAAGIIMRVWGDDVHALEILGAAGLDTVEKLKACGVEQYDIDALLPALATTEGSNDA
jgi:hypothetical protein